MGQYHGLAGKRKEWLRGYGPEPRKADPAVYNRAGFGGQRVRRTVVDPRK